MATGSEELKQLLMQRQGRVPTRVKRFETAEAMKDAYRNNWEPNPILLKILQGNK